MVHLLLNRETHYPTYQFGLVDSYSLVENWSHPYTCVFFHLLYRFWLLLSCEKLRRTLCPHGMVI